MKGLAVDYFYDRARLIRDRITADQAGELYRKALELDGSDLTGDLEQGFRYWSVVLRDGAKVTKLVRCDVKPIRDEQFQDRSPTLA